MLQLTNQGAPVNSSTNTSVITESGSEMEPSIFKVHHQLRSVNSKAYEPVMIAIGPYHRSVSHVQPMEAHKKRYQALLLKRMSNNEQLDTFTDAIRPDAEKALKCYSEPPELGSPTSLVQFLNMLVLDGMFIVELLLKFKEYKSAGNILNDHLFKMPWALCLLQRDLMLFENQLPLFILEKLYGMIPPTPGQEQFQDIAIQFFFDIIPGNGIPRITPQGMKIKHFLDLIHMSWGSDQVVENGSCNMDNLKLMGCSTDLWEAGVKFEKIDEENSFKIKFENGVLRIPVLNIETRTESVLRNLIAFEQYSGDNHFHIVTDYMAFFTYLIKSENDVARLTHHGIFDNFISDDKLTTQMFTTIIHGVAGPNENFQYAEIFEKMRKHRRKRVNRYMANFWHDYANGPWDLISTITVALILFLTILEVTFQILSWKKQK